MTHNETAYANGCRCDTCRTAHAEGERRRRRQRAYGTHVPKSVPIAGTRRRIQALMTLGWSQRELSRRLGFQQDRLNVMLTMQAGISPRNAARVAELYDALWNKLPPQDTKGQRIACNRTKVAAARLGYAPPLAWDDDEIDNPEATPPVAGPGGAWDLTPCGTTAAARRHYRRNEPLCAACKNAERRAKAERTAA